MVAVGPERCSGHWALEIEWPEQRAGPRVTPRLAPTRRLPYSSFPLPTPETVPTAFTPPAYPQRGSPRSRAFATWILRLFGWRITGALPEAPRFVLIVAPHTSNWDFPICMLAMFATGLRLTWLAKHDIFFWPVRPLLKWAGGMPVDRGAPHGVVTTAIRMLTEQEKCCVGISPEGTRKHTDTWKTGFHRIAMGARVPIFPIWIDYPNKLFGLGELYHPTGDIATDVAALSRVYRREMALYPERYVAEPRVSTSMARQR